ncbi:hypothetical protein KZX45_18115 [Georgenia sp. EYE_87]|uniref:hypothetical protein n=1 Tax=Georgenia sp. EYE_87 TaxID=2853448 RepID=UPI002005B5BF|nr:hypothetical protein [Georgenia sp. EYE_87]MCK6212462.1 hypothetical protein [Georgenia sp. EYE_87]
MAGPWNRTEGVLVAASLDPGAVADHLGRAGILARLEWYPGTEHLLSLAVLTDPDGAVGTAGGSEVLPGPELAALADDLGTAFEADVLMDGVHSGHEADRTVGDDDGSAAAAARPATAGEGGPEGGVPGVVEAEDTEHDARTVVLTPMPVHQVPLHATLLGRPVTVAEQAVGGESRRLVMTTGPGRELGVLGWESDAYPVLRLQVDAEDRTALLLPGPESDADDLDEGVALVSWAMRSRYVLPDDAAAPVRTLVEDLLGDGEDAAAFAAAVPGSDPVAVAASLGRPGAEGMAAFVVALGLPPAVADVLEGRAEPADLPGARTHEAEPLPRAAARSARLAFEGQAAATPPAKVAVRAGIVALGVLAVVAVVRAARRR